MLFSNKQANGLRVLMYHKITCEGPVDFLSVTTAQFEQQIQFLKKEGYTCILFSELLHYFQQQLPIPEKSILLSFDDGYYDNYANLYPLLQQHNIKANIFLVCDFIEKEKLHQQHYMNTETLKKLDPSLVEFGLHSYKHDAYTKLSLEAITTDIAACIHFFKQQQIQVQPCFAYPYGSFERNIFKQQKFLTTLNKSGIQLAFRIGNRVNHWPLKNPMLIQRIDVRGDESFEVFCNKVRKGKSRF